MMAIIAQSMALHVEVKRCLAAKQTADALDAGVAAEAECQTRDTA
jgi:hypothetical protein